MGIITDAQASSTGLQIYSWKISILDSINNIENLMSLLNAQLANMQANTIDFTAEDVTEMQTLIAELNTAIALL